MERDDRAAVLHALRLCPHTDLDSLARQTGIDSARLAEHLDQLVASGWARPRPAGAGWTMTPAGREEVARHLAAEVDGCGARDRLARLYERFLVHNDDVLAICTQWQVVGADGSAPTPNDHLDPEYDRAVVHRLHQVHGAADRTLADVAGCVPRFGAYRARLATAVARVDAGETDWFTSPLVDSYHTIWFTLHEDLLSTLGLERSTA